MPTASILDKLAALDRPEIDIIIKSKDGERELSLIYVRPTLAQDQVLQKTLSEEYDNVIKGLKEVPEGSEKSVFDKYVSQYVEAGAEVCANYLIRQDLWTIRADVIREQELKTLDELPDNATEEEKKEHETADAEFMEIFKPAFDARIEDKRKTLVEQNTPLELATKAANIQIEQRAMQRSMEIHRRNLVAKSIYHKEDGSTERKLVFTNADQVASILSEDTVLSIANKVSEELEKQRNLPFNSAGKK